MNTTNLISTPNIGGNIGSCTSLNEKVTDYKGLIKETGRNVITNSCTGQVEQSKYTEYYKDDILGGIVCVIIVITFIFISRWFNS